ncbi:XisI protein [Aphanothece hegewaldii CCALA 016]|uniref:XisI protein n=1 Tax=Aphanothece hegewaldii CCALA 016 TaxID=2107694 RepID=A0A2T1LX79_9CHRO|nr:XisI protein [Aphanothece hegewaldii]PSF36775.1 XisI protein [Aphanothece hegewaldii CCALA 016]
MDKINLYRQHIQELLTERAKRRSPNDPVTSETVFDTVNERYLLVHVGWKNNNTRIYGCIIHVDLKDEKIWVQYDGTEDAIADQLVERGVPKKDIVLAYHAPNVRQYTEFALG